MKVKAIKCPDCLDIIYSRALHDYRNCSCGMIAIDGGQGETFVSVSFPPNTKAPDIFDYKVKATKKRLIDDWDEKIDHFGLVSGISKGEIFDVLGKHSLYQGRMLSFSKSLYRHDHPKHDVLFNAAIFVEGHGYLWSGDLNLTLDKKKLVAVAGEINRKLYILRESDAMFDGELEEHPGMFVDKAHCIIGGNKHEQSCRTKKR